MLIFDSSYPSKVSFGDKGRWLIIDAHFESRRAPIDERDVSFILHGRDRGVDILGNDVTPIQKATGHVFPVPWIAFDHLIVGFETFCKTSSYI